MDTFLTFSKTFLTLFIELIGLFIFISFLVSFLQRKVTPEKIEQVLHRPKRWLSYVYGALFGALTPFCSCSTIPILAGLLSSRAPFGPSIAYLIASPLLNPVILILFISLIGVKFTIVYFIMMFFFAILTGFTWEKLGFEKEVKKVRVHRGEKEENTDLPKWKLALADAWGFFYPLLPYILLGVFIGAAIHNFIPESFIIKYASGEHWWTIPIAALIGIPMYIRVEAIIPISSALLTKGMGIGSILALIVGGAGASIPEMILLSKLFKRKLVFIFMVSVLLIAILSGLFVQYML
ncbi:permease [Massilibacterium senegalense]|uniref:permease n=1 Tax=Massilibacterium senegalense TaxID=1632858 RepID=UPI00078110B2|nr:permease [Massilibacterium senegalense]